MTPSGSPGEASQRFDEFVARVRALVDARLAAWLDARVADAAARGADLFAVADALRRLALRGGKRMRAVLLAAGYVACGGGDVPSIMAAGVGLELLQAYLLTHDDWMDGDEVRRGGPSVPAMLRDHFASRVAGSDSPTSLSACAAVLAGDLASSWALASMMELEGPPTRTLAALRELARVGEEVVEGQVLDVCAGASAAADVEEGYALKTASYTVRGPVVMGARLAGADDALAADLAAFAVPLGVAFQLRDDLLGAFGDPAATGKPAGGDLRKGKRTLLVLEAQRDPAAASAVHRVLGREDAGDAEVGAALRAIEGCGARARVEARIVELAAQARGVLGRADVTPAGRELLSQAVGALAERDR